MWKKAKWFIPAAALALALFFGPATSKAFAWDHGPRVGFSGRFVGPHGQFFVRSGHFPRFAHRPFFVHRPFFAHRAFFPRFRSVRVFVYDPFPHWVVRRVYYDYDPYYYPY